jgi:hypothetical protein
MSENGFGGRALKGERWSVTSGHSPARPPGCGFVCFAPQAFTNMNGPDRTRLPEPLDRVVRTGLDRNSSIRAKNSSNGLLEAGGVRAESASEQLLP